MLVTRMTPWTFKQRADHHENRLIKSMKEIDLVDNFFSFSMNVNIQ